MLVCPNELMPTQVLPVPSSWSGKAAGTGSPVTNGELAALHTHLVLQFPSTCSPQHRPGCAFVAPYPRIEDHSPNEILVIPFRSGAALFSIGFFQGDRSSRWSFASVITASWNARKSIQ